MNIKQYKHYYEDVVKSASDDYHHPIRSFVFTNRLLAVCVKLLGPKINTTDYNVSLWAERSLPLVRSKTNKQHGQPSEH